MIPSIYIPTMTTNSTMQILKGNGTYNAVCIKSYIRHKKQNDTDKKINSPLCHSPTGNILPVSAIMKKV